MKAAALRLAKRTVHQEGASEIPRGKQMKVEKVGVAREVLPSNSSAQQLDTIGMQVDQLRTVREVMKTSGQEFDSALGGASKLVNCFGEIYTAAVTADNGVAASLENPIVLWSPPSDTNPEGKYAPQIVLMICAPVTGFFEIIYRSQVRITSVKFLQHERQLNEMKTVEPQAQREAGEHQISTVAPGDTKDGMIQEKVKELEELDEPHELSEDDEAMIDALLQELELEIAFPVRDELMELFAEMEGNESFVNADVSAEGISENNGASSSEGMIEAEEKCGSECSHLTGRFERPNSLVPIGVIQQHPALSPRRRLWVPHRKHGRRKHEHLQMGLHGLCWPSNQKHGRWKPGQTMMPPLALQLRPDVTRRWCSQRKRSKWKSVNRYGDDACPPDNAAMYVKLHPPNT